MVAVVLHGTLGRQLPASPLMHTANWNAAQVPEAGGAKVAATTSGVAMIAVTVGGLQQNQQTRRFGQRAQPATRYYAKQVTECPCTTLTDAAG